MADVQFYGIDPDVNVLTEVWEDENDDGENDELLLVDELRLAVGRDEVKFHLPRPLFRRLLQGLVKVGGEWMRDNPGTEDEDAERDS